MRIQSNFIKNYQNNNMVSFKAGVTNLYSDFDNTFMPKEFNHNILVKQEQPLDKELFRKIFTPFNDFVSEMKEKMTFTLTSGRSYYETKYNFDKIPKDLEVPKPQFIITSNGSDILERSGNEFNYVFSDISKKKETTIKELSGWDVTKIKMVLSDLLKADNFSIIESKINSSKSEYNGCSIEDLINQKQKTDSKFASIRTNEHLHMNIAFSKDTPDEIVKETETKIKKSITSLKINAQTTSDINGIYSGGYKVINISPKIDKEVLSKLFDAKKALQNAMKNNDLVIVAGDASNDKEMLNIFNYIDTSKYKDFPIEIWSDKADEFKKQIQNVFEYLETSPQLKKEIDDLPLISIIVDNEKNDRHDKLASLKEFLPKLNHDGIIKFVKINAESKEEPSTLLKGIKTAIQSYTKQNPDFSNALIEYLSPEINKEINISQIPPKKLIHNKIIAAGTSVIVGAIAVYTILKSRIKNKNISATQYSTKISKFSHSAPNIFKCFGTIN